MNEHVYLQPVGARNSLTGCNELRGRVLVWEGMAGVATIWG